jgi:hypothetical protein
MSSRTVSSSAAPVGQVDDDLELEEDTEGSGSRLASMEPELMPSTQGDLEERYLMLGEEFASMEEREALSGVKEDDSLGPSELDKIPHSEVLWSEFDESGDLMWCGTSH